MKFSESIFSFFYGNGIVSFLRILTGCIFLASGTSKIIHPSSFASSIALYGPVPDMLIPYIVIILPCTEIICGALLTAGLRIRAASMLTFFMLCLFTALIAYNVVLGKNFECGCVTGLDAGPFSRIGLPLLGRNIALLACTVLFFRAKRHPFSLDYFFEKSGLRK
jgi:uncharacterized membrane protein YphA (DoxX/SURF4 family)